MSFANHPTSAGTTELTPYAKVDCTRKYYKDGNYIGSGGCSDYKDFALLVVFGSYSSASYGTIEINGIAYPTAEVDFGWSDTHYFLDESDTYIQRAAADAVYITPVKNKNPDSVSDHYWYNTICEYFICFDTVEGRTAAPYQFDDLEGSHSFSLSNGERYYSSSSLYDYSTYHYNFEIGIYADYVGGGCGSAICL